MFGLHQLHSFQTNVIAYRVFTRSSKRPANVKH